MELIPDFNFLYFLDLSIHQLAAHGETFKVKAHLASGKKYCVLVAFGYTLSQSVMYFSMKCLSCFDFRQLPTEQSGWTGFHTTYVGSSVRRDWNGAISTWHSKKGYMNVFKKHVLVLDMLQIRLCLKSGRWSENLCTGARECFILSQCWGIRRHCRHAVNTWCWCRFLWLGE